MTSGRMLTLLCAVLIAWGCVPQANKTASPEDKKTLELHYSMGIKFLAEGKTPQATKEFMAAQAVAPDNSDVEHALGLAYQQKGLYDQAIFQYKKAITLDPKLTEARNNMGTAYLSKGMYAEAMAEFEHCLKDPTYGTPEKAAYNIGFACLKQKKVDKAIEYYQKAIEMQPENPNALFYLGLCYLEKDNTAAALEKLNKVVVMDPSFQDVHFRIGTLYEKQGQHSKAMASFKKACEQDSANIAARLGLGRALLRIGNTEEGLKSLETVVKADAGGSLAKEAQEEMDSAKAGDKFKGIPKVGGSAAAGQGPNAPLPHGRAVEKPRNGRHVR